MIYQTAHYQVNAAAVDRVRTAITEFVDYVRVSEAGTKYYAAWQEVEDPTRFVHLFIFESEEAQVIHGESDAVHQFESVYRPELVDGPVIFTNFIQVATNS